MAETVNSVTDDTDSAAPAVESSLNFPVVGIGASAGGLNALLRFFEHTPAQTGMAFVVILHLSPKHESNVDAILQRATRMPVKQVTERLAIEANHVYVISPTRELLMSDGELRVAEGERPRGRHVAIDVFFRTLAQVHKALAVSVVLSGTGSDGALGLTRIKEQGGITLVQSPDDAEYDGMPLSAIATGMVDLVLPVAEMPQKLIELWDNVKRIQLPGLLGLDLPADRPPNAEAAVQAEQALHDIMVQLRARTGHDFKHYKRATVLRRVERRLQVNGLPTLPAYRAYLEARPEESTALLKDMLISVTNFFRDREAFEALERQIATDLFDTPPAREQIRAWVAGCATGEEAYSLAILLAEQAALARKPPAIQIFATDIDERAIAIGRAGAYPEAIVTDVPPGRLRQFFVREQGQFRIRKSVRERILFAAHNLLRDPPFSKLDLVCCRNLLIYLDRSVQIKVLSMFHYALQPGGLLFLGTSESAEAAAELFSVVDKKHRIFRANVVPRQHRQMPSLPDASAFIARPLVGEIAADEPKPALAHLHQRLLADQGPASVLVDHDGLILHVSDSATRYLRYAGGAPSHSLLDAVRPELRLELRTALFHARSTGESVLARQVKLEREGRSVWLDMTARPVRDKNNAALALVTFNEVEASLAAEVAVEKGERDPMLNELERELQSTRDRLQSSIGRSESSNEELKAANEELQAMNEELRSATEELETSKEELQSVNEELITVNSELKAKVDETAKTNDDLSNLIASTDLATVFVDPGMRIKRFTPRATDIFNIIGADVGRSLLDITRRLDYDELEHDVAEAFQSLRLIEREVRGSDDKCYLVRVLPYRTTHDRIDGAVLTFVDISATRRAEDQVRLAELHMRLVAESTRDYAIITLDPEGRVTTWNKGAERMFGYLESEMVGHALDTVFTPQDRAAGVPADELRRAREEGRAEDERWQLRKDGSLFFCSGITTPLDDGRLHGYAKIARDLTDSKLVQSQREALLENEKKLRAELQGANALKDEFLAVMSHELKHPLNLIHVNAELLTRLPEVRESPGVARVADVIRRTVLSQAKIIDDLLDLSRLRTGKLSLNFAPIDWAAIIERLADAVQSDARAKDLAVSVEIDAEASIVFADAVRVEQIVWNLLSNALKFTPEGGRIQLRLVAEGSMARLDVADTGRGIQPEFLGQVFTMFRQASGGASRQEGGLGIGLALVNHLTELHGGSVAVSSRGLGQGACFSVWLPLYGGASQRMQSSVELPALEGMRILVVDDTPDTLEAFGELLKLEGANVTLATSGPKAIEAAETAEFDLVLSDIAMPGMDGYELMAELRKRDRTAKVMAVAVTGFGRPNDETRAREAGFDAHVAKPVELAALLQIIHRLQRGGGRLSHDKGLRVI